MSDSNPCVVSVDDMKKIATDLNEFVVCFDRIFSRLAFSDASPDILVNYMLDRDVRLRLAEARSVVWDSLREKISEEEADDLSESGYEYSD
ncbi:hypothetical protein QLQ12_30850 [Actinoplanes sp. NEAU-A12]|uniref:Uncharacterized protein n=1 Tax=Actinoplanes sandaracinus TaxID=3045177 RepID=A0ABT6WTD9_9ACTN|nr:hypothetical protein [Actinoplanes sandaracinus]MDI6103022.1 hypothetical protein [Actinoplanes sandaracinus]